MDSSTAVAYINHKGGTHSPELLQVALQLWNWVHSAQPIHNIIPFSRENQCGCRSRVERIYRQQRLENIPDNHFSLSEGVLHRPVCVMSDASTCQIHQLEARPPSILVGRLQCELETPKGLRIPSVQPHRAGSRQGNDGQDGSCSGSTNMASASLVDPLLGMLVQQLVLLPSSSTLLMDPTDPKHIHPKFPRLHLGVFHISSNDIRQRAFRETLPNYSSQQLEITRRKHTSPAGNAGGACVIRGN